jgi:glycosyltransferase involved in cell wall biosynthesis
MIVKNEEKMLRMTLQDLSKSVDEVILVDTGSTDATVPIAKELGIKVRHFKWIDDFSAARNESLKHATGDWIIWIDADEHIKPDDFIKLKDFLKDASGDAYNLTINECPIGSFSADSFYFKLKVFRSGKGIHFERPINENLFGKSGRPLGSGSGLIKSIPIYHWGNHKSDDEMRKKNHRNIDILKRVAGKRNNDVNCHFLLGNNYKQMEKYENAIAEYKQALALRPRKEVIIIILTSIAGCFFRLNKAKEAYKAALEALKLDDQNSTALNIIASVLLAMGKVDSAIEVLEKSRSVEIEGREHVSLHQRDHVANLLLKEAYQRKNDGK